MDSDGFIRSIRLKREEVPDFSRYPFSIPAIRQLDELEFHPDVTYLVGENGSGKSTIIEAIASAANLNPEGGSRHFDFSFRETESELHEYLVTVRNPGREKTAYFLRAESFFNLASQVDDIPGAEQSYGGTSLHEQSHGESFLSLLQHRFGPEGLYLLDEPEAALSPQHRLSLLVRIDQLVDSGSQFVVATHSPIVMAYPDAMIYRLGSDGVDRISYEETEHYQLTRQFLNNRDSFLRHLFDNQE